MDLKLLKKYATLMVKVGANVQKDQTLVVNANADAVELTRLIVEAGYEAGAKSVEVMWGDPYVSRHGLEWKSIETLKEFPKWQIDRAKYLVENNACIISMASPVPGLNQGIDSTKLQTANYAQMKAMKFVQDHMMGNHTQWCVVAAPNPLWAKKVYPELEESAAVEALWKAILEASRVTEDNDPIKEWAFHNKSLSDHNKLLTEFQFESLHFTNGLGTDLDIKLVDNHVWSGGIEQTTKDVFFNPNIPTEENFTMPHKLGANGKVFATKPLNYQGKLIEDFWLEFKDGKVINYGAKKQVETLKNLLEVDEGSKYLGEVALISFDSPINNTGILFFNTLFDENASCHLALGRAYPMNVLGGTKMSMDDLVALGYNKSMVHSDFMFGSKDMHIVGTKKDGTEVVIFKNGNYIV